MFVSQIINEVAADLLDSDYESWTKDEMLSYYNDAVLQICTYRPDALSEAVSFMLSKGNTKHSIPVNYLRMIDGALRNMGADGATIGRVIRVTDLSSMDIIDPKWHSKQGKDVIKNIIYNDNNPKEFYTVPASHLTNDVYIEAVLSKSPTNALIADFDTIELELDDIYKTSIKEFIYYRAYSKETDSFESRSLAMQHLQTFYNLLGIKIKVDMQNSLSKQVNKNG